MQPTLKTLGVVRAYPESKRGIIRTVAGNIPHGSGSDAARIGSGIGTVSLRIGPYIRRIGTVSGRLSVLSDLLARTIAHPSLTH